MSAKTRKTNIHRLASVLSGAAILAAAAVAPAYAGVPDANLVDCLRAPMWTSIAMQANSPDPSNPGYWTYVDGAAGGHGVQNVGSAPNLGNINGQGGYIRATPSGNGYYAIQEDGTMYQRGDATAAPKNIADVSHYTTDDGDGTMRNPVTGMAITPTGKGGWVVDAEGDVWTFGDAHAYGSPEDNEVGNAVDIVATPDGKGYTILTNAGDVYDYGDATFYGHPHFSADGSDPALAQATGIALTPDDKGYWILDNRGEVLPYGDAVDLGDNPKPTSSGMVATDIATLPDGSGYAIITDNGTVNIYRAGIDHRPTTSSSLHGSGHRH